jgi:succinoglycan biosynthesis protein ExoA
MDNPFVTIILPVRNESVFIARALISIANQDYPADQLNIIIADGLSYDNTCSLIQDFSEQFPLCRITLLQNHGLVVPTGMNLALRIVKSEIIIRVDGHCVIAPDYVSKCVAHLRDDGVDGVGGPITTMGETPIAKAIALAMSSPFGVGNSSFRTTSGVSKLVDTVPFPAYTRQIVERAGLYDEELVRNQDDEYNYRIRELGGKILLADDIHSIYYSRASFKALWRQYFQYGFWKVRVMQKHPHQMSVRQFIPPVFVFMIIMGVLFSFLSILGRLGFASLLAVYIFANLGASLWTASRHDWKFLPLLPLVFTILHVSYGLGFWAGLVKFWNRWGDKVGKTPVWTGEADG